MVFAGGAAHLPAYTLPPPLLARAQSLARLSAALSFGSVAVQTIFLLVCVYTRAGDAVAGWAGRRVDRRGGGPFSERPLLRGLLVTPAWLLALAVVLLPLETAGHAAALRYGLSVERWPAWWLDWIKSEALSLFLATLVVSGVFVLLRRSPRWWWIWLWLLAQPVVVAGVFLAPVVVDPLFNHFTPLVQMDPGLASRLEQVAAKGGLRIPVGRMFVEDASRRSTGMNAYVTGIGASRRIVVWDTTLAKVPQDEILAIYAHEQGHYVLHHIAKGILFSAVLSLALLALLAWCFGRALREHGEDWHIADPADWAALPLLLLLASSLSFLSSPAVNAFSRGEEHAADVYGERLLGSMLPDAPRVEVEDFDRLGRAWLEVPQPNRFLVWWSYSHPPTAERAAGAARVPPQ